MLTRTFSSSRTLSNTEAKAILSKRNRNRRNTSNRSFSGFNIKRRGERREARRTVVMALRKDDDTEDKDKEEEDEEEETSKLSRAMATARQNEKLGFSPGYVKGGGGGGVSSSVSSSLLSAEESAEAAFADLINTSNDDRNEGDNDVKKLNLSELAKGSRMSEEAVRQKDTNIGGVLGDLINLGSILLKGGHIVKKKDGRV